MRVIAHGVDLVHCPRIERMLRDHRETFLARVFTPAEQAYCLAHKFPATRLSGRFAVKEAVFKALGTGWRGGIQWTDVETLPDPLGRPLVSLHGRAAKLAEVLQIEQFLVSITHAGEYALASVIGIGGQ
jgi:holo-[acyl-carrier protein] synthase